MAVSQSQPKSKLAKRQVLFTGGGTWVVPPTVTFAIAHMRGGGGGGGERFISGGNGGDSSVDFASGLESAPGGIGGVDTGNTTTLTKPNRPANSGEGGGPNSPGDGWRYNKRWGFDSYFRTVGGTVTPGSSVTVVVGAGGTTATGAVGGSGIVSIEYFERV